jgi:PAS domain S-box-containing protein
VRDDMRIRSGTEPPRRAVELTEHQLVDEQLRLQSSALAAADNGIVITDIHGRILWVNPAFTRLTGYTAEEAIGHTPRLLKSGKHDQTVYRDIWDTILSGQVWRGQLINRCKDGSLYTEEQTITPVRDEHGTVSHFIAIKHDVTECQRAQEEIRRLNEELEQRVRQRTAELTAVNRELEAFSSSVSHDLRAPLRSIQSFSKLLLDDHAEQLGAQGKHYLERVHAASQRMQQLIDDLLNLARVARSEMRREKIDLGSLVQKIAAELSQADPDRPVEFVIAPGLAADGDPRLLRVALENLLNNAWKYTSKHLTARIEFGQLRIAESESSQCAIRNSQFAMAFFVRDDGAGFDTTYAHKLFAPFQRLHSFSEFEGTGIGLAIVQRIIHRHGGRIWAEGGVERGATFYFTLGAAGCRSATSPFATSALTLVQR